MINATATQADVESWFQKTRLIAPDAIFALTAQYLADSDPRKVNLGQGTYRDGQGQPWVLPSVIKAREALLAQGLHHEYLPILGLASFRDATAKLVLGSDLFNARAGKVCRPQAIDSSSQCSSGDQILDRNLSKSLGYWGLAPGRIIDESLPGQRSQNLPSSPNLVESSSDFWLPGISL